MTPFGIEMGEPEDSLTENNLCIQFQNYCNENDIKINKSLRKSMTLNWRNGRIRRQTKNGKIINIPVHGKPKPHKAPNNIPPHSVSHASIYAKTPTISGVGPLYNLGED